MTLNSTGLIPAVTSSPQRFRQATHLILDLDSFIKKSGMAAQEDPFKEQLFFNKFWVQ